MLCIIWIESSDGCRLPTVAITHVSCNNDSNSLAGMGKAARITQRKREEQQQQSKHGRDNLFFHNVDVVVLTTQARRFGLLRWDLRISHLALNSPIESGFFYTFTSLNNR